MEKLCESLGYSFNDHRLLVTALTHPSYGGDHHVPHYQRLEFLGDAVLELTMSEYLFEKLPEVDEGKLTRIRAAIVREETLAPRCEADFAGQNDPAFGGRGAHRRARKGVDTVGRDGGCVCRRVPRRGFECAKHDCA